MRAGVIGLQRVVPPPVLLNRFISRLTVLNPMLYPPYHNEALSSAIWSAYDAVTAYAMAIENITRTGDPLTGANINRYLHSGTLSFSGPCGLLSPRLSRALLAPV
jgi:hypothetical protein